MTDLEVSSNMPAISSKPGILGALSSTWIIAVALYIGVVKIAYNRATKANSPVISRMNIFRSHKTPNNAKRSIPSSSSKTGGCWSERLDVCI